MDIKELKAFKGKRVVFSVLDRNRFSINSYLATVSAFEGDTVAFEHPLGPDSTAMTTTRFRTQSIMTMLEFQGTESADSVDGSAKSGDDKYTG